MQGSDVQAAYRFYLWNWAPLAVGFAIQICCQSFTDFSYEIDNRLLTTGGIAAVFVAIAFLGLRSTVDGPRWWTGVAFALGAIAQLHVLFLIASPLTYIAAAANFPMQDANLAAIDRALGLSWPAYLKFVYSHQWLIAYAYIGYAMITWPMLMIPTALGLSGQFRRLQHFTTAHPDRNRDCNRFRSGARPRHLR